MAVLPKMLDDAVKEGLEHTKELEKAKEVVGGIVDVVLSVKGIVSSALSTVPQAAAAWTGMMLVFEARRFLFS
jgi:N-terminal domain of NWD NACHT-NTPase